MELKSIMSGSIDNLEKENIRPRLTHFIDLLDSYNLMNVLTDDNAVDMKLKFAVQKVENVTVQTVIGSMFRINLHEDDSIHVTISKKLGNFTVGAHDKVEGFKDILNELKIKHRTIKTSNFGNTMKSTFEVQEFVSDEDILRIFQYLNLD